MTTEAAAPSTTSSSTAPTTTDGTEQAPSTTVLPRWLLEHESRPAVRAALAKLADRNRFSINDVRTMQRHLGLNVDDARFLGRLVPIEGAVRLTRIGAHPTFFSMRDVVPLPDPVADVAPRPARKRPRKSAAAGTTTTPAERAEQGEEGKKQKKKKKADQAEEGGGRREGRGAHGEEEEEAPQRTDAVDAFVVPNKRRRTTTTPVAVHRDPRVHEAAVQAAVAKHQAARAEHEAIRAEHEAAMARHEAARLRDENEVARLREELRCRQQAAPPLATTAAPAPSSSLPVAGDNTASDQDSDGPDDDDEEAPRWRDEREEEEDGGGAVAATVLPPPQRRACPPLALSRSIVGPGAPRVLAATTNDDGPDGHADMAAAALLFDPPPAVALASPPRYSTTTTTPAAVERRGAAVPFGVPSLPRIDPDEMRWRSLLAKARCADEDDDFRADMAAARSARERLPGALDAFWSPPDFGSDAATDRLAQLAYRAMGLHIRQADADAEADGFQRFLANVRRAVGPYRQIPLPRRIFEDAARLAWPSDERVPLFPLVDAPATAPPHQQHAE